jgi:small subunit ribosomal protein S8
MDPIADFLTSIRNGYLAKKPVIVIKSSRIRKSLGEILVKTGYLKDLSLEDSKPATLKLTLNYTPKGEPVLTTIKRISKPGVRRYAGVSDIPGALSGAGVTIVSTSAGLLTDKEARSKHLGGEVICQLW